MDKSILAKLRCPKSGSKLIPAPPVLLARLRAEAGFVSEDAEWFYPVEEGFPVLTADAAQDISALHLDWDDSYQTGETPWDKGEPAPPLVDFFKTGGKMEGTVFVPGCGRGHDAREVAKHGADVTALDISPTAIDEAKSVAKNAGSPPTNFIVGDLFDLDPALVGTFDWLLEHTCLSGLPPSLRPSYFEAVTSVLKPGGKLFAIWFVEPDMDPGESGPPFGISTSDIEKFTADKFTLVKDWVPEATYEGRENRERVQILEKMRHET